ncbi:putative polysaccharide biosynthesis protein [Magnetofaba australis IT-1]|uniref:Putative polysaccharide biosynthesis protein n=2 Tax=Magnetofaba TaxID=1472292 RepID=A0A1Y2K3N3_9PROT|nr:putative polysaccharide biosynthesis protein [Magnetofaba australis IT-1]
MVQQMFGQSALFMLGTAVTVVGGFLLKIFVTNHLGAEGYGVFTAFETAVGVLILFAGLAMGETVLRFAPQHVARGELLTLRRCLRSAFRAVTIATMATCALWAIGIDTGFWSAAFSIPAEWMWLGWIFIALIPLQVISGIGASLLRSFGLVSQVVKTTQLNQIVVRIVLVGVALSFGFGLPGYVAAVVLSTGVMALFLGRHIHRQLQRLPQSDAQTAVEGVVQWRAYTVNRFSASLVTLVQRPLCRLLIARFGGMQALGVLAIVEALISLPQLILQALLMVITPMFSASWAEHGRDKTQYLYTVSTDWISRIGLPLILFMWMYGEPLLALYGESFSQLGQGALQILLIGQVVTLVTGPIGYLLIMCGQERAIFRMEVEAAILVALLLAAFTPLWGLNGAAAALASGQCYGNLKPLWIARKNLQITWWSSRYWGWALGCVSSVVVGAATQIFWPQLSGAWLLAPLLAMFITFLVAPLLLLGVQEEDRWVLEMARNRLLRR